MHMDLGQNSRVANISRILDQGYTKICKDTALYICKLIVDIQLEGLDLRVFPLETFPKQRVIDLEANPEENLRMMPIAAHMSDKQLKE